MAGVIAELFGRLFGHLRALQEDGGGQRRLGPVLPDQKTSGRQRNGQNSDKPRTRPQAATIHLP